MSIPDIHPALLDDPFPPPRRIPRAARALIPELRHFPDEQSARRHFHEAWVLLRRSRFFERFHILDLLACLLAVVGALSLIVILILARSGGFTIILITLLLLMWMGMARLVNLHKGYRIILREDLRALGRPLCLTCGIPLRNTHDSCSRCTTTPEHTSLLESCTVSGQLKRYPTLAHFTTLSGALRALHGAERGWKHVSPHWHRTLATINAALAALIVAGLLLAFPTSGISLAIALAIAVPAHIALNARDRRLQTPFAHEFVGARLAREGKLICISCNYDIAALRDDNPNCPECGEPIPHAQQEAWRQFQAAGVQAC